MQYQYRVCKRPDGWYELFAAYFDISGNYQHRGETIISARSLGGIRGQVANMQTAIGRYDAVSEPQERL